MHQGMLRRTLYSTWVLRRMFPLLPLGSTIEPQCRKWRQRAKPLNFAWKYEHYARIRRYSLGTGRRYPTYGTSRRYFQSTG